MAGMSGPVIDSASMIFPMKTMKTMSWDEIQVMVRDIVAIFDTAGWTGTGRRTLETITPDDFSKDTGPKQAVVGRWAECNDGPAEAEVWVQHDNSQSPGSFMPPAVLSPPIGDDAEDRFPIYASFSVASAELRRSIGALAMARREAEGIDPANNNLPARIWLDDPDWRPAGWAGRSRPLNTGMLAPIWRGTRCDRAQVNDGARHRNTPGQQHPRVENLKDRFPRSSRMLLSCRRLQKSNRSLRKLSRFLRLPL